MSDKISAMTAPNPLCGLLRAAALARLGQNMFYCWSDLYDLPAPSWGALSVLEQHLWVQRAQDNMDSLKPPAVTCPPVGAATPLAVTAVDGGGVTRPVSWFELAADLARRKEPRVLAFRGLDMSDGRD